MLTQERLKKLLKYNCDTGIFTHKKRTPDMFTQRGNRPAEGCCNNWNSRYAGKECGGYNGSGYIVIGIDYHLWRAHRLAWLYVHGELPKNEIDHINHIRDDNRIINLRCVTRSENNRNMSRLNTNTSGFTGVAFDKRYNVWIARVSIFNKEKYIGTFKTKEDAINARIAFNKENGFHRNHGLSTCQA